PGTGSKTGRLGSSDTTEVAGFRAAAQPIASKLARPPGRSPVVGQIDNVAAAQPIASKLARPPGRSPVVGQIDNVRF
ncbi:hypothetical protein A258_11957, partial [Pseudomonas syringae pv. actinidiae ICMP 19104]